MSFTVSLQGKIGEAGETGPKGFPVSSFSHSNTQTNNLKVHTGREVHTSGFTVGKRFSYFISFDLVNVIVNTTWLRNKNSNNTTKTNSIVLSHKKPRNLTSPLSQQNVSVSRVSKGLLDLQGTRE